MKEASDQIGGKIPWLMLPKSLMKHGAGHVPKIEKYFQIVEQPLAVAVAMKPAKSSFKPPKNRSR